MAPELRKVLGILIEGLVMNRTISILETAGRHLRRG
jgi:hypothetical protein